MFSNFEQNLDEISLEDAVIKTCKSIEMNQLAMSNILNMQIEKIEFVISLIKEDLELYEYEGIIREINSLLKILISYEYLIENKLDTISKVYSDFINI